MTLVLYSCLLGVRFFYFEITFIREMHKNETCCQMAKHVFAQDMEEEDPESNDSDPEREGQPDNEEMSKRGADGTKTDKESYAVEEQQEYTDEEDNWHTCSEEESEEDEGAAHSSGGNSFHNSSCLLRKDELLEMFKAAHNGPRCKDGQLTVGLVC